MKKAVITLTKEVRDELRRFKKLFGFKNYSETIQNLIYFYLNINEKKIVKKVCP
jgi:hypothetical protein